MSTAHKAAALRRKRDKEIRVAARIKLDLIGKKYGPQPGERQHLCRLFWSCVAAARRFNREAWQLDAQNR